MHFRDQKRRWLTDWESMAAKNGFVQNDPVSLRLVKIIRFTKNTIIRSLKYRILIPLFRHLSS